MKKRDYEAGKTIISCLKEKRDKLDELITFLDNWLEENKFESD